jgi:pimeloyl-ACP methyl ester carboxylesterase
MKNKLRPAYAYTDRGVIHYAEVGVGEPLLLLHATPGTWRSMAQLIPLLANDFRVIALDTPGYGNSDPVPGTPTIDAMAISVISMLDELKIPKAHIAGLHTGNKIAASMAAQRPERVGKVVLAGHTHSLLVDKAKRDEAINHLIGHYFPNFEASFDGSYRVREWLMAYNDVNKLWWPPQLVGGAKGANDDTLSNDVAIAESMVIDHLLGWRSIVPTYSAIFEFDLAQAMRHINTPTQILELRPSEESFMPAQAPIICQIIRGAQQVLLSDVSVCETNRGT